MGAKELLKDKWVILDTNLLYQMTREKRSEIFRTVFNFLKEQNAEIFLLDSTYFEVIGFTRTYDRFESLNKWVRKFPILRIREDDINLATRLSMYYRCLDSNINPKQISFCDCLNAAQLIKYKGKAFLVTTDIYDYPISLFNISKLFCIEDNKRANIVAIITYDEHKWKLAEEKFKNSRA